MNDSDKFRIEVQDERARRRWAERQLEAETERASLWRTRAEERTARIKLLEERIARLAAPSTRLAQLRAAAIRWRRGRVRPQDQQQPEMAAKPPLEAEPEAVTPADESASRPGYPHIRVATLGLEPVLTEFDAQDLAADPDLLYDSDFVWISATGWKSCRGEIREAVIAWMGEVGRQRLVLWHDDESVELPVGGEGDLDLAPVSASGQTAFAPGFDRTRWLIEESPSREWIAHRRRDLRTESTLARAKALVDLLGIDTPHPGRQVGALLISNKPDYVVPAVAGMLAQQNVDMHLVVGLHGPAAAFSAVMASIEELAAGSNLTVLRCEETMTLGECLNRAARECRSPYLAKIDDDDHYGPHYLEDAVAAFEYSNADVVGKASYYVELGDTNEVVLVDGVEEGYVGHVIGSSLVVRRSFWERTPFPHRPSRVDSVFLRAARAAGATIYSQHRFEFGVRRRGDGHTWQVDRAHFVARGQHVGSSLEEIAVDVDA